MSKKVKTPDKKKKRAKEDRLILTAVILLGFLAICVAAYGIGTMRGKEISEETVTEQEEDPLLIKELIAGQYTAEIKEEDGEWLVCLSVDEDFPFRRIALNMVLAEGAVVSSETNCLLGDVGDRPIVNLGVQDAALSIKNGELSRTYRFQIDLL